MVWLFKYNLIFVRLLFYLLLAAIVAHGSL